MADDVRDLIWMLNRPGRYWRHFLAIAVFGWSDDSYEHDIIA